MGVGQVQKGNLTSTCDRVQYSVSSLGQKWLQQDRKEKEPHNAQERGSSQAQSYPRELSEEVEGLRGYARGMVSLSSLTDVWVSNA